MGYGGWTDRDTAEAFADYARVVVNRLGDRSDALSTFNEPWCSTYLSHWIGKHMPGERSIDAALAAVTWLALAGSNESEIASITGHELASISRIMKHYLGMHPDLAKRGIGQLTVWYDSQVENKT